MWKSELHHLNLINFEISFLILARVEVSRNLYTWRWNSMNFREAKPDFLPQSWTSGMARSKIFRPDRRKQARSKLADMPNSEKNQKIVETKEAAVRTDNKRVRLFLSCFINNDDIVMFVYYGAQGRSGYLTRAVLQLRSLRSMCKKCPFVALWRLLRL